MLTDHKPGEWFKSTFSGQGGNCVETRWKKSTFSGQGGDCVETILNSVGGVDVRDSKDPNGATLSFTPAEWRAFIGGAKDGEFDLPPASSETTH